MKNMELDISPIIPPWTPRDTAMKLGQKFRAELCKSDLLTKPKDLAERVTLVLNCKEARSLVGNKIEALVSEDVMINYAGKRNLRIIFRLQDGEYLIRN